MRIGCGTDAGVRSDSRVSWFRSAYGWRREGVVQGAVKIAYRLRVPPLLVGFTIVAIGTSLPELAVALEAIRTDSDEIAIGGVLGSNVALSLIHI